MKKIKVGEEGTMDFFFWGGAEGEGERESQADFLLSVEPHTGSISQPWDQDLSQNQESLA